MTTGWPPGLLQDDDRKLSRWFAGKPDARYQLRKSMKDDIIKMAREAGILPDEDGSHYWISHESELQCFANIVEDAQAKRMHAEGMVTVGHMRQQIAAEREACAKECEHTAARMSNEWKWIANHCAAAIRARGQA